MESCCLVLGGGGLKACAHIGLLQAYEEEGIPIDCIAGASSGALIAAFYAMGYSAEELKKIMFEYSRSPLDFRVRPMRAVGIILQSVLNLLKIGKRKTPLGLIRGQQLENYLRKYYGNQTFEGLRYPLMTTAVDLCSGRLQIFTNKEMAAKMGRRKDVDLHTDVDLVTAVCAGTAIPGIFTPVHYKGMVLVDGGIRGVIPANVVKWAGGKNIVAIDLSTVDRQEDQFEDLFAVLWETIEIMGEEVVDLIIQQNTDMVIHPELSDVWLTDFEKIQSVYDEGYRVAMEKMPELRALLEGVKVRGKKGVRKTGGLYSRHTK